MSRRWRPGAGLSAAWGLAVLLGGTGSASVAVAASPDAAALAQGGVWIFDRVDLAPGAPVQRGGVAFEVWRADPQAGIEAAGVRIVQVQRRHAAAVVFEQLQSPVLHESACRTTWQWRFAGMPLRAGATVQAARREFDRYGSWWRFEARAGAGWCTTRASVSVALQMPVADGAMPQLHAGAQWRVARHTAIVLQADPDPLRPGAWHLAWSWDAPGCRALAGYDAAANAVGVGLDVARGSLHVVWGARMHPELGWSHAWSCVWQR